LGCPTAPARATVPPTRAGERALRGQDWLSRILIVVLLSIPAIHQAAWAQERSATRDEIVGSWEMVPLSPARQPNVIANPWPAPCQWYRYSSSGTVFNMNESPGPCRKTSSQDLDKAAANLSPVVFWKYEISTATSKGVLVVTRTDVKNYVEYWNVHVVTQATPEFKSGDLLMYLMKIDSGKAVVSWIRHLRRIS
jgi:hypothetical protein